MNITSGVIPSAKKVVIYGPEGIGKSTLASHFPDPLFIDTEGSTKALNVKRFDAPKTWLELVQEAQYVLDHTDVCQTLVIDTADWAEKLCIENVCIAKCIKGIEDIGYGKGYVYVKEDFGKLLNQLSAIVDNGINVVLTAHAMMRKFEQPDEMGAYDRWELKLSKQCAPLVKEWCDILLFCNYETLVINVDGQGSQKGKNKAQGGKRVMYATHHPCWDAKNRYGLKDKMAMSIDEIAHVIGQTAAEPTHEPEPKPKAKAKKEPPKEEPKPAEVTKHEEEAKMIYRSDTSRIPKALLDLMQTNGVDEWDVQNVVSAKGYYPADVLVQDYDPGFIDGVLIGAWDQVYSMIKHAKETQEIPFN